jgi:hypothetical protein
MFEFLNDVSLDGALIPLVPALLIIGSILKQTPKFPDWLIVWALFALGVLSGGVVLGFNFEGIVNGVIAAGLAISSHQAFKQTNNRL